MTKNASKSTKSELNDGIDGRIVTFHGRAGEAQLKAIISGKDVVLYRWKRGLDSELRVGLAQDGLSQKCGVLTSDASVIAALDAATLNAASHFDISLGRLTGAEETRLRDRPLRPTPADE